jgi:hypothetical protein
MKYKVSWLIECLAEVTAALERDYYRLAELREWRTNLKECPDACTPMPTENADELAELEAALPALKAFYTRHPQIPRPAYLTDLVQS